MKKIDITPLVLSSCLALFAVAPLAGCDGDAEEFGEDVDEAVEDTGEALEDAADEVDDGTR